MTSSARVWMGSIAAQTQSGAGLRQSGQACGGGGAPAVNQPAGPPSPEEEKLRHFSAIVFKATRTPSTTSSAS